MSIKEEMKENGEKLRKAIEAVNSLSVKKYIFKPSNRVVWIVVGKKREYFVIPNMYCQCNEFYINVVIRRKCKTCYHIIAQSIAEKTGKYEVYEVPDDDYARLINEWKKESI
ncbi:MAG: hypothetical protein LM593_00695 [Candidatus Verstraetearchaeota archaeon]|nr:hypothetical protein [Candidatus Verstraetearchaeota archaeon]